MTDGVKQNGITPMLHSEHFVGHTGPGGHEPPFPSRSGKESATSPWASPWAVFRHGPP